METYLTVMKLREELPKLIEYAFNRGAEAEVYEENYELFKRSCSSCIDSALKAFDEIVKPQADVKEKKMHLTCFDCGKIVSSLVNSDVVVRGITYCPECSAKNEREEK